MAEEESKVGVEEVVTQDLRVALRAAKDLIESLREYSKNLATDLDEAKDQVTPLPRALSSLTGRQVNLLKARLHETTKGPEEDKAEQKRKLQAWLKEAASEKEAKMQTAMLAVENRNLRFELEALKTGVPTTPSKKQPRKPAAASWLGTSLLYVLGGVVLGAGLTALLNSRNN